MTLYHIPAENDDKAFEMAKFLEAAGFAVEVARSYHPLLNAYVMVDVAPGQDVSMIRAQGGYSIDALLAHDFSQPVEEEGEEEEVEEETEPEPEENVTEETEYGKQEPHAW